VRKVKKNVFGDGMKRHPKLISWDYIEITWKDCTFDQSGWNDMEQIDFEHHTEYSKGFISVGLFVKEDADNVYISHTTNTVKDAILGFLSIPKGAIMSIRKLK
jgi:hypothetical protein